jgi:hypothetical protein
VTILAADPRASKRPGLVFALYAYRAVAALLIALPATALLSGGTASAPRGQAELFDPGAVMLLESVRFARRGLGAVTWSAGAIALLALLGSVIPLGALLAGISSEERPSIGFLAERAFKHAGTLALVLALGAMSQLTVIGLTLVLGGKVLGALSIVPPSEDIVFLLVVLVALALAAVVGVVRDLACVAAVRDELRLYSAGVAAFRSARRSLGRAIGAWAWRAALGTLGVVVVAVAAPPIAATSPVATAVSTVLHQLAILGATVAHASWLAAAMRIHDASQERV